MNFLKNLSDQQKGILLILLGTVLLFDALGIFKPIFYYVILVGSIALIIYGLMLSGYWHKILSSLNNLMKRSKKEVSKEEKK